MFSSARALVAAGAVALALAATALAAQAAQAAQEARAAQAAGRYTYVAFYDVGAAYDAAEASESAQVTRETSAIAVLRGTFYSVRFVGGMMVSTHLSGEPTVVDAKAQSHYVNRDVEPAEDYRCSATSARFPHLGSLMPLRGLVPGASGLEIGFTPFAAAEFDLRCGANGGRLMGLGGRMFGPRDGGADHLRMRFEIPREKLGDRAIVIPISAASRSLARCPGDVIVPDLRSCSTSLAGTIRMYLLDRDPDPAATPDAPAPPSRARLDRTAARATATVRCPRGCSYRIRVFLPPRSGRGRLGGASSAAPRAAAAAAGEIVVATKAGRLPASRAARTLALAIPAARRAAVEETGGALVGVTLDPPKGRTVSSTSFARAG